MSTANSISARMLPALSRHGGARRWYVAFSGGLDSTVLLHLMRKYRQHSEAVPPLAAIHIDHGLQEDSNRWAEHCRALCEAWDIPIQVHAVAVDTSGASLEAAARKIRYYVFKDILRKGDVVFTAHHLDDQVETFFLRAMRGAGVDGLAAIPVQRKLGQAMLVRPLLAVSRRELEACASEAGLDYIDDPSNSDTSLDRNFLRHQVLPLLEQRWPSYRDTVGRAARHLAETAKALRATTEALSETSSSMGDPGFYLESLLAVTAEGRVAALRKWLRKHGLRMPDSRPLEEFLRQLQEAAKGNKARLDTGEWRLQRFDVGIYLLPPQAELPLLPLELRAGDFLTVEGVGRLSLAPAAEQGFVLPASGEVDITFRRGGERCQPLDRGGSVSLKKLLQESNVPPWWRGRVPLVHVSGELAAVGDRYLCECAAVSDASVLPRWILRWDQRPVALAAGAPPN